MESYALLAFISAALGMALLVAAIIRQDRRRAAARAEAAFRSG